MLQVESPKREKKRESLSPKNNPPPAPPCRRNFFFSNFIFFFPAYIQLLFPAPSHPSSHTHLAPPPPPLRIRSTPEKGLLTMTWGLPPTLCDPMVVEGGGGLQESWQSLCLIRLLGDLGGEGGG